MEPERNRLADAEKVQQLIDKAFTSRYHDVPEMLRLSRAAVDLADEKHQELPADLVIAAWTQYGNALRIAGQPKEAEKALQRAAVLPTSDIPTKTQLLEVTANLYRNTGRFREAVQLLTTALDLQWTIDDPNGEARVLNLLGINYLRSGQPNRALEAYQAALDRYSSEARPDAVVMTGYNLAEALIANGRLTAAAAILARLEPSYRRITSSRLAAKAEWTRARLCRALRQWSAARQAYERAQALLITEPRSPEIPLLLKEMAELGDPLGGAAETTGD